MTDFIEKERLQKEEGLSGKYKYIPAKVTALLLACLLFCVVVFFFFFKQVFVEDRSTLKDN